MLAQIFGVIIGVISLIVYIIFLIVTRKSERLIKVLPNSPFIEIDNSRTRFTNGYSLGIIKKILPRKNKTFYIEFYPTDVIQGENVDRPEIQRLIVAKEFIKYPKKSARRQTIQTIARIPTDIPEDLRETIVGEKLIKESQEAFLEKIFAEAIPNGDERAKDIVIKGFRGLGKVEINTEIDKARANNQINSGKKIETQNPGLHS